jgi:hypothetical protein
MRRIKQNRFKHVIAWLMGPGSEVAAQQPNRKARRDLARQLRKHRPGRGKP